MRLRPSASHIWFHCPASAKMTENAPADNAGDPAREGTCAAWVAEMVLTGERERCIDMIGETHENGWPVESDMAQLIQGYVNNLRSHGEGQVFAERFVRLNENIAGTPDGFAIANGDTLHVDDLKYGYSPVEPFRNTQVGCYTGALLKEMPHIRHVIFGIYQPRCSHPLGIYRTWSIDRQTADRFVAEIIEASQKCLAEKPAAQPDNHCEYCPAAAMCYSIANVLYAGYDIMATAKQRHMGREEVIAELAFIERMEKMVKGRKTALHAEATARIAKGEVFQGWHMESGRGQRRFKNSLDAERIEAITGVSPLSDKLVTPAELERRGANIEVVQALTETPTLPPKLKQVPANYYAKLFDRK